MRKKYVQMSLSDIYDEVSESIKESKPELIALLEEHLDFDELIPMEFKYVFYKNCGRDHLYHLESFIKALVLQKLLGIQTDRLLITILKTSTELRDFCGFAKVPDASQFTRFREQYCGQLKKMFEHLVDVTEPICREINEKKADYLIYDTTGIELAVAENNPKFMNTKLQEAKKLTKKNPEYDPYLGVYALLPDVSEHNRDAKQQYINGHFCYAMKFGLLTNGLGILRHIEFFDDDFKTKYPEIVIKKTDSPDIDKEISDSASLKPVLTDFIAAHPKCSFKTFLGDASFDSYDNYAMLMNEFHFDRVCVPLNLRNSKSSNAFFDENGTPLCPVDGKPFTFLNECGGKNRSRRFKWVCPCSVRKGSSRICTCEHPCTDSKYGRCVYTYPHKNLRLYPGIPRNTEHWDNLYRHRVFIERTINLLKDTFSLDARYSIRSVSAKSDVYLAGITQLVGVVLADALHKPELVKSVRRLIS